MIVTSRMVSLHRGQVLMLVTVGALFSEACSASPSTGDGGGGGTAGSGIVPAMPRTGNVFVAPLANPQCMPRALAVDAAGLSFCFVAETRGAASCDCTAPGRVPLSSVLLKAVEAQLIQSNGCAAASDGSACVDVCACGIAQEMGTASAACKSDPTAAASDPSVPPGFCYLDDPASPLLATCKAAEKRMIGFVSPSAAPTPSPGAALFIVCEDSAGCGFPGSLSLVRAPARSRVAPTGAANGRSAPPTAAPD